MGMNVSIFKANGQDCSNGGISSMTSFVCVTNVEGFYETNEVDFDGAPGVMLVPGNLPNTVKAVPVSQSGGKNIIPSGCMFGGTYIAASDSRFNARCAEITGAPFHGAVPLHDRIEN